MIKSSNFDKQCHINAVFWGSGNFEQKMNKRFKGSEWNVFINMCVIGTSGIRTCLGVFYAEQTIDANQGRPLSGVFFLNYQSILYNKGKHEIDFRIAVKVWAVWQNQNQRCEK